MKINYLKINGFGKLSNKEVNLSNNINLIYGSNEAGKTTFLKFIAAMFFGTSKNKNGREISDFDKYKPWRNEEFSGKIQYELDNKQTYEVFRDFTKKNPVIYNEKKEDISKQFNIDKNKGNEFFYEQTKIDESLLFTTSLVEQKDVVLDDKSQNILTQKITNLLSTGDDNISYIKSIDKLNKKLMEEVGTERSTGRPINIIMERISNINYKKKMLEENENKKENIEINKINLKKELKEREINIELIKEIKILKENENIEKEKIKIKENIKDEYNEKIIELENKLKKTDGRAFRPPIY